MSDRVTTRWSEPAVAGGAAVPADPEAAVDRRIPRAFEHFVRWTIDREWEGLAPGLRAEDREAFARYYRALPAAGDRAGAARYLRGLWCTESGWVWRWLNARAGAGCGTAGAPRVLDAGSGFGTFSMLFASQGAEVVGADLREDRVRVAQVRLEQHRMRTARPLAVEWRRENLTDSIEGRYDLIWVYNALSHIEPPARFLAAARAALAPGGVLVIGDINGANAGHRRRLRRVRQVVEQQYVSPEGVPHAYAVERTFAPGALRAMLARSGLKVVHHELFYFGIGSLPDAAVRLLRPLQRCWRLGQAVGRRQLVVARPADAG